MSVSAQDGHAVPIYAARLRITFPLFDTAGDLKSGAAGLDSEISLNSGSFNDCTNEATEIGSSGIYTLDLTSTELTAKIVAGVVKSSDAKHFPFVFNPQRYPVLRTGTAQAGGSSSITLDASASADDDVYNGSLVNITNNTPSNALGQARRIVDYVGSTKVATIEGTWGTNPNSSSTFELLMTPESMRAIGTNLSLGIEDLIADWDSVASGREPKHCKLNALRMTYGNFSTQAGGPLGFQILVWRDIAQSDEAYRLNAAKTGSNPITQAKPTV